MKATALAPANIAFVKYWGKKNTELTLPQNSSISMNLEGIHTITTVDFSEKYTVDQIYVTFFNEQEQQLTGKKASRIINQLNRLREMAQINLPACVKSINNFPADAGIASSASAFAALTLAICQALKLKPSQKQLSILTRLGGSGSATRSIPDGFVEWKKGTSNTTSFATQLAPESHWALYDLILVVSQDAKKVSSLEGHEATATSPYFSARLAELSPRLKKIREAISERNLTLLGSEIEKETLSLHLVAMTSHPPIWYWESSTLEIIKAVYELRAADIECYFTIDAGPNVHIICNKENVEKIKTFFMKEAYIDQIFVAKVGKGARLISEHLF